MLQQLSLDGQAHDDKPAVDVNKVVDREMSQYDYLAEIERE